MRVHTLVALATFTTACSPAGLDIAGLWNDDFGTSHEITEDAWIMEGDGWRSQFWVQDWDNELQRLVAQNDSGNDFNPDLYSRFEWTWDDGGDLWYCQSVFDAETQDDADAAAPADPTDPANGGCGGFPWSMLSPAE